MIIRHSLTLLTLTIYIKYFSYQKLRFKTCLLPNVTNYYLSQLTTLKNQLLFYLQSHLPLFVLRQLAHRYQKRGPLRYLFFICIIISPLQWERIEILFECILMSSLVGNNFYFVTLNSIQGLSQMVLYD